MSTVKDIYVYPLVRDLRRALGAAPAPISTEALAC